MLHGLRDPLFPGAEVEAAVARLAAIFAAAGAGERCRHVWGDGGHHFYGARTWPWVLGVSRLTR